MQQRTVKNYYPLMAVVLIGLLGGCADNYQQSNDNHRQGPPSTGQKGRGGQQGPPSMMNNSDNSARTPPAEAIAACVNKRLGDSVEFTTPHGKTIIATCQEYEDHLVATPKDINNKSHQD